VRDAARTAGANAGDADIADTATNLALAQHAFEAASTASASTLKLTSVGSN
jgi:hypothetical protein